MVEPTGALPLNNSVGIAIQYSEAFRGPPEGHERAGEVYEGRILIWVCVRGRNKREVTGKRARQANARLGLRSSAGTSDRPQFEGGVRHP